MGQICSAQSWTCTVMFLWGKKHIQVFLVFFLLKNHILAGQECRTQLWAQTAASIRARNEMARFKGQQSVHSPVRGTLSFCLCCGRKRTWLGTSRMRFLMLRSVRRRLRCPSDVGMSPRQKTALHLQKWLCASISKGIQSWDLLWIYSVGSSISFQKNWFTSSVLGGFLKFHSDSIAAF